MTGSAAIQAPNVEGVEADLFVASVNRAVKVLEGIASEIATTNMPVLITGESGTGKQVLARRIHELSVQRSLPMTKVICGSLTPETILAELGLNDRKQSRAGTVVFDEVGDLDRESQRKLLHALPDNDDASARGRLTARLISTASQNLEDEVRAGRFRGDLYYRVNGICLRIPPLRERREDIPVLTDFFLTRHAVRLGRARPSLSAAASTRLAEHAWSGNVRELENVTLKILALGEDIALADLSASPSATTATPRENGHSLKAAARAASREAERDLILKALARTCWNRKRAAQELQISYKSLLYKLKQIGLPGPENE